MDNATQKQLSLDDIAKITPLKTATLNLMTECRNPDPDLTEIIKLIESDPALTSKVMAMANSPAFGFSHEVNTIERAVVVIGLKTISNLAATVGTKDSINDVAGPADYKENLYKHLLACAIVARNLAAHQGDVDPSEAFVAGILHDIGKLLFLTMDNISLDDLDGAVTTSQQLDLEKNRFGLEHQEIGQRYAELMGLPMQIADAIGKHNEATEDSSLQSVICQANRLCRDWQIGPHNQQDQVDESSTELAGDLEPVRQSALSEYENVITYIAS